MRASTPRETTSHDHGAEGAGGLDPITVEVPARGLDRGAVRESLGDSALPGALASIAKGAFGQTVATLRALEAVVFAADLAIAAGGRLHAALLEDIARTGTLAIPEPTRDQRLFLGAFTVTVLGDLLEPSLSELAPVPDVRSDLESSGLEALLELPPAEIPARIFQLAARYLEVQARRQPTGDELVEREAWVVTTLHAFVRQLHGAVGRLTHGGRLRPFGVALARRKVTIGPLDYQGFRARPKAEPVTDLKPVAIADIVGNRAYLEAGMRLARDVAAFDLVGGRSPKRVNPVLFALGRPGCGKTISAHAIGNYFLEYCRERGVPARFRVIRRTDWASAYQNASANQLVRIFREEVYAFDGVCGVYWPDIDTAFASRSSGDLRMEEKNNLGAVFGIFDGTLIPKDGKWFMMCDANFMQMDEATTSRIAQNPFHVHGPEAPEDYVRLLRDVLLRDEARFVEATDADWISFGEVCRAADLSGRAVESIAGNVRSEIQDFEYPADYFSADFPARRAMIEKLSRRVPAASVLAEIDDYVRFHREAEAKAARERFEQEVGTMVRQLNAGREAANRAAEDLARTIEQG